ncbi:hypothetical protein [uncultured Psychroserpens sp.]|uniref:hypothetical protein n=1 Tax=uncultured Psychroserpens sp. TaxID=255436 RepID=UPI0026388459|nr:hypothetical protein [uncultured Psychroserpens sp.]
MKYLIITIVIVFTFGSDTRNVKKDQIQNSKKNYKVFKIDSIGSFYLVYLRKGNLNYKVISEKLKKKESSDLIEVGEEYNLSLYSIFNQKLKINNKEVRVVPLIANCVQFEKDINICKEKDLGINDLHYTPDLRGLYIIR